MVNNPVVVGYDGSAGAAAALRWALDEAARLAAPLRLVYAVERPLRPAPVPPMPGDVDPATEHRHARSLLDRAVGEVSGAVPPVEVSGAVLDGPAVTVLCEQSRDARLVVVGSRGLGGFTGLFVGSVSLAVAAHADSPVVVVRGGPVTAPGPVAVGVDESAREGLVGFAMEEAAARGVGLLAVRAWTPPSAPWPREAAEREDAERHRLSAALHAWSEKYPTVPVTTRLIDGDARHALAAVSGEVQLIVVGSRGRGGFEGLVLGSVSQFLLHHARCPVAVVREPGLDREV